MKMVCDKWKTPAESLILFSPKCTQFHISSRKALSDSAFQDLLTKSGGSYGHAQLYVLEVNQQQEELMTDTSCLDPLGEYMAGASGQAGQGSINCYCRLKRELNFSVKAKVSSDNLAD